MTVLSELAAKIHDGSARKADLEGVPAREIRAIKSDNGALNYRAVFRDPIAKKAADDGDIVLHDASTEDQDSMGDVILVKGSEEYGGDGWQLGAFRANPQLLYAHQSGSAGMGGDSIAKPIGTVLDVHRGTSKSGEGPALVTKSRFHGPEMFGANDPWGGHVETVKNMVMAGAMPGSSVGFLVREIKFFDNDEERVKHNVGPYGGLITEQELRENSVVPIPANPNALQRSADLDAIRARREAVLERELERGMTTSQRKEFDELFPFSVDDLREVEKRCRRRSVQVLNVRAGDQLNGPPLGDGNPVTNSKAMMYAGIQALAADIRKELRANREMNEQLSLVLDDLRESMNPNTRAKVAPSAQPPVQPDPRVEFVRGLTRAAAAANSNGAKS